MSTWECRECTALYAPDAPACPHCRANDPIREDEQLQRELESMPKITVHGGPSNADTGEGIPEPVDAPVVEPVTSEAPVVEEEAVDYTAFTVDDLKTELKDRALSVSGTKDGLIDRLYADDAARAAAAEKSAE